MTKEKLAKMLDGREYGNELNGEILSAIEGTDLVVLTGGSDDYMRFSGAFNADVYCCAGGTAYLTREGLLLNHCDDPECPYFEKIKRQAATIHALWAKEGEFSWTYQTDIPHATFVILEDTDLYCRGIVFNLSDVT